MKDVTVIHVIPIEAVERMMINGDPV
jgi:hypothetical protein